MTQSSSQRFASPETLEAFAAQFALALPVGAVLVLLGDLGAGKTTFVRGLARGLGVAAQVSSPTFGYIHQYPSPSGAVVHIDAYRLPDPQRLWGMGLQELLEVARVVCIEWGESLAEQLRPCTVLRFFHTEEGREICIESLA